MLSVYGTNDGVLSMPSYKLFRYAIKGQLTEVVIEGGNHAQFGDYGAQSGDNEATITAEEQVSQTAEAVGAFFARYAA